jgi:hypothetical protein
MTAQFSIYLSKALEANGAIKLHENVLNVFIPGLSQLQRR